MNAIRKSGAKRVQGPCGVTVIHQIIENATLSQAEIDSLLYIIKMKEGGIGTMVREALIHRVLKHGSDNAKQKIEEMTNGKS